MFLHGVPAEWLNHVLAPRLGHKSILRLRHDLDEIDGGEEALRWICEHNGVRWDWSNWDLRQRERLVEKLWELVERGVFAVLHKFQEAVLPAFHQADGRWEPSDTRSLNPDAYRRFAIYLEQRTHEEHERKEWQSRNQPLKPEVLESAAGPGTRPMTLGPHVGGSISNPSKKSVTPQEANELFKDAKANEKIPFDYPLDCCYSRAHEMCRQFESKGVECGKAWFYGEEFAAGGASLKAATPVNAVTPKGYVNWTYHVAPAITVTDGSTTKTQVIDPSLFDKPVDVSVWTNRMNDPKGKLEFSDSSPYFRMPGNSAALKDDDYSKATEQMEKHARERDRKIRAANKTK